MHCFNHRIELAAKDTFGNSVFEDIEQMLSFLYKLYQNSSKRLKALRELGVAIGENQVLDGLDIVITPSRLF